MEAPVEEGRYALFLQLLDALDEGCRLMEVYDAMPQMCIRDRARKVYRAEKARQFANGGGSARLLGGPIAGSPRG